MWLSRTNELSAAVQQFSDEAASYWAEVGRKGAHERANIKLQEARLLGMNTVIDGMWPTIGDRLDEPEAHKIEELLNEMTVMALGGEFGSETKEPRPSLPEQIIRLGASIRVMVQEEVANALTLRGWWRFVWQRADRIQTAAERGDVAIARKRSRV
ncbi:hypothetical protein ABIE41_002126 [Bosea sp. OAE506]|uniref:hypothetical protein n=1 Tax=Bosea sp. OAE506 TaxID=2663870 RepID=UPI001789A981